MNAPSVPSTGWARWPPQPRRVGRDLNPWLAMLLVTLIPIVFYEGELRWMIQHRFASWVYDPTVGVVLRHVRLDLLELALILLGIAWLGWWGATGWRRADVRIPYRWGLVPLTILGTLTLAACASTKVAEKGLWFLGLAITAIFIEALTEELLFRGSAYTLSLAAGAAWQGCW